MKTPRFTSSILALAVVLIAGARPSLASGDEPKPKVLINFADSHRDSDGEVFHAYEYAFGDWDKHIVDLAGQGVLIKAETGKGGLGENKTLVEFSGIRALDLVFVIGNANHAHAINFSLTDGDGTEWTWGLPLDGRPKGAPMRQHWELARPNSQGKPGEKPGLNLKKIASWQVKGDWADANVEVLLIALTGSK